MYSRKSKCLMGTSSLLVGHPQSFCWELHGFWWDPQIQNVHLDHLGPPIDWTSHNKVIYRRVGFPGCMKIRLRIPSLENMLVTGVIVSPWTEATCWMVSQETHIEKNLARRSLNSPHLQGAAPESGRIWHVQRIEADSGATWTPPCSTWRFPEIGVPPNHPF